MNESKMLQKASLEEEAISQFQKEKNYQLDRLKATNEEELLRIKREYENKVEEMYRQIQAR